MKGKMKMAQGWWSRAFGLAALGLVFCLSLAAQAGDTRTIEQQLEAKFKLTKITDDRMSIVSDGDRVEIQKPGVTMYDVSSPMPPLFTYKNGKIGHGLMGFGKDVAISFKTPGGTAADYSRRPFEPGEKCWVTGIQVQKDGVLFQLYSDRYDDNRYYANLKIPFSGKKETPPATVMQLVEEVLKVAPPEKHAAPPVAVAPAATAVKPAPKSQPAGVSGKYNFDEGDSQLNFVSSTGCIMIGPGGTQSAGKYRVDGDALTMDCTVTGSEFKLRIQGDKLVAVDGHVWLREAVSPPLPPSVSIGQSRAQVTASFGQPLKVKKAGAKEVLFYKDMKVTLTNGKVSGVE
jgi:hypothetical protein